MSAKGKGSAFERQLAKYLTEWASGQKKDYYFWRTPGSGGVATVSKSNANLVGDIHPIRDEVSFMSNVCFEAKNGYKHASFDKHLDNLKGDTFKSFWIQCYNSSITNGKIPILVFQKKQSKIIRLGTSDKTLLALESVGCSFKDMLRVKMFWPDLEPITVMNMDLFFKEVTFERLKKAIECYTNQ